MGKLRITVEFINPRWWITEKSGGVETSTYVPRVAPH